MSGSKARAVQKLTGWKYTRALDFVRANNEDAKEFAQAEGITRKDAFLRMAEAEMEINGHGD